MDDDEASHYILHHKPMLMSQLTNKMRQISGWAEKA